MSVLDLLADGTVSSIESAAFASPLLAAMRRGGLVTAADLDAQRAGGEIAHRGTGTFYQLIAPAGRGLALVRRAW